MTNPGNSATEPLLRAVLLRYHEVALKGANRRWFEDKLAGNTARMIARELNPSDPAAARVEIKRQHGRILIESEWNESIRAALGRVFGLSSFSPIRKVPTDRDAIKKAAVEEIDEYLRRHGMPKNFRVTSRRSDKVFPETSTDIDHWVGAAVHEKHPELKLELKKPELVLGVEIHFNHSFLWTEKIPGQGGLPVGGNGRVLSLISGGLDSPVAAIQVLRRGSPTSFIHFYGTPFVGEEALTKVEDLVGIVNRYQPEAQPLHVVPFGKIQEKIALATNPKMRTLLYRRMMVRVSCALARKIRAHALITGESLGQVASQTVENMAQINAVADMPILRPLITYDKDEIIAQARKWGSYETSILPAADCCTLFADRHPTIRGSAEAVAEQEARFPVNELVQEALDSIETRKIGAR